MKNILINKFKDIFKRNDGQSYFSPARVNLIGEHIDYNGGFVFPCALSIGTYGIIAPRNDDTAQVCTNIFDTGIYRFSIKKLIKDPNNDWTDYIKGVLAALEKRNFNVSHGFDLYIHGNMPHGAGLSSSASLESLIVTMLDDMFKFDIALEQKALIGQDAENNFVGVNSGIMDQFAIIAGKKDHAILLNTENLSFRYTPLNLNDYRLLIVNTNKKRGLSDSKYNERFTETREALGVLKPIYLIENLCELKPNILPSIENILSNILYKRVHHVVTEQQRTLDAAKALINNDLETFGLLMNQSHESLKNDYDVTGLELDTLQALLLSHGAIGARMTGAGFGGSCIAVVHKDKVEQLRVNVQNSYTNIIGYSPTFIEATISDGTSKI